MDEAVGENEEISDSAGETLHRLLQEALRDGASHLHLDPGAGELTVRFRIDGVLHPGGNLPKALERALVGRVKVIAGLDLTERRVPQTGVFALSEGKARIRAEVAPTLHGERVTLTIQRDREDIPGLEALGLREPSLAFLKRMAQCERGLILAAGPGGSGKSTLLTALLREAQSSGRHVASIECPIERPLEGVSQMEVNPSSGCDLQRLLASVKRQDVDVLLCAKLEDSEAVRQVIHLAAEGCLVLAGMHTQGAVPTITRLMEMGIEPFLVGETLLGVTGLRLVRRICGACREALEPEDGELEAMGLERAALREGKLWRGRGCPECRGTGFRGRTGLQEVLVLNGKLRDAICRGAEPEEWQRLAGEVGFESLRQDGLAKVRDGATTWAEVLSNQQAVVTGC